MKNDLKEKIRKGLALTLAAALVVSSFTYFGNNFLRASESELSQEQEQALEQNQGGETVEETAPENENPAEEVQEIDINEDQSGGTEADSENKGQTKKEETKQETRERTVYTYEDKDVKVTATLSNAEALPDNAELVVTELKNNARSLYVDALNKDAAKGKSSKAQNKIKKYNNKNTLIYDMAFVLKNKEIQPESGSVKVNIEFKNDQLSEQIGASKAGSLVMLHLPLKSEAKQAGNTTIEANANASADDVTIETLDSIASLGSKETISFDADNFSSYVIANEDITGGLNLEVGTKDNSLVTAPGGGSGSTTDNEGFITVEKNFSGITKDQIPAGFSVTVKHKSTGKTFTLNKSNADISDDGLSWRWKLQGVGTGTYNVSESGEAVANYNVSTKITTGKQTYTGKSVDVEVTAATITYTILDRETTCSHVDWPVIHDDGTGHGFMFGAAQTHGNKAVIISEFELSTTQKEKVNQEIDKLSGNWKTPCIFFSIEKDGEYITTPLGSFTYHRSEGKIYLEDTSQWSHVLTMKYDTEEGDNPDVNIQNDYTKNTGHLKVKKVVQNSSTTAKFDFNVQILKADGSVDTSFNGTYGDVTFTNGVSNTFQLGNNEEKTISNLPVGTKYKVVETAKSGFAQSWTNQTGTIAQDTTAEVTCKNTYSTSPTSTTLGATKSITGRQFKEGDSFTFTVIPLNGAPAFSKQTVTVEPKSGSSVNIDFGTANYTAKGEYKYTVTETKESIGGIAYDTTQYTVTVNVDDNGAGQLVATKSIKVGTETKTSISFTNRYSTKSGETDLKATKNITGRTFKAGDEFTFTVTPKDGAPAFEKSSVTIKPASGTSAVADFGKATYTAEGTYEYTVKETKGSLGGIDYDTTEYTVVVEVKDNGAGQLVATKTIKVGKDTKSGIVFTNPYTTKPAVEPLGATKTITGRSFQEGDSFTFTVTPKDGAPAFSNPSVTIEPESGSTANVDFGSATFNAIGTYEYTVKETKGSIGGIDYDTTEYTVVINVSDNGAGQLVATKGIKVGKETKTAISFTNPYSSKGSLTLGAKKTLSGKTLAAGDFSFELKSSNGDVLQTKTNAANGTVTFDKINYTQADLSKSPITYTISEVIPSDAVNAAGTKYADASNEEKAAGGFKKGGITYDSHVETITVTLSDDGKGTITATPDKNGAAVAFGNSYSSSGSTTLGAEKTITGRQFKQGDSFTFTVTPKNDAPAFSKPSVTVEPKSGSSVSVDFGSATYTAGGTYEYTVKETKGSIGGIDYDETEYTVTVSVVDNGDGTFNISKTIKVGKDTKTAITFNNDYSAEGETPLGATKSITGRDFKSGDSFNFTVTPVDGAPAFSKPSVTVEPESGSSVAVDFGTAKFTAEGDYKYTVKETKGSIGGIDYDETEYTVVITATDNLDGTFSFSKSYKVGKDAKNAITFTNDYSAKGDTTLGATKTITGRDFQEDDTFTFTVAPVGNAPAFSKPSVTVEPTSGKSVAVDFGKANYTAEGKYEYIVTETKGSIDGITYDTASYKVTVEVTDNLDGTLSAVKTYEKTVDGVTEDATAITFTNEYDATGSVVLSAKKVLNGRALKAGEFTFVLKDADGNELQTKTNAADGTVTFDKIDYTVADVANSPITYTISELDEGLDGITYATNVETIKVTLVDNKDGTITATADKTGAAVTFTNTYESKGSVDLSAEKVLVGRDLTAGEFSFVLKKGDTVLQTKTNAADGTVTFDTINYTQDDVKNSPIEYTISEVEGSDDTIAYAKNVETITVTLTDNGDGTITATADKTGSQVQFINTYSSKGSVVLSAKKTLNGRPLKAGEFSFVLKDANGSTLQTKTNAANGTVTFDKISYTLADVENSPFEYTISEVIPSDAVNANGTTYADASDYEKSLGGFKKNGITYDETVYDIEVELEDDGAGHITATADKTGAAVGFTNDYTAEGELVLSGEKTLLGRVLAAGEFSFVITDADGNVSDTKQNAADGSVTFDTLTYSLADMVDGQGSYSKTAQKTYYIYEYKDTAKTDIEWDPHTADNKYEVTVALTDNEDGTITAAPSDSTLKYSFVNKAIGSFEVSKFLISEVEADKNTEFKIIVTLYNEDGSQASDIQGQKGDMLFVDGVATVYLKGGESATASGLLQNLKYTVEEVNIPTGFEDPTYSGAYTGGDAVQIGITNGETVITNTRELGSLEVKKTVSSKSSVDFDQKFSFEVKLSEKLEGQYGQMTFREGTATFDLKHGETMKATDLPVGITYTVTETPADDYTTTSTGEGGQISASGSSAEFTNTRNTGVLEVTKSVNSAKASDLDQKFDFTVTIKKANSDDVETLVDGTFGGMTFDKGVATFQLANGETKTASGLPIGVKYEVTETDVTGFTKTYDAYVNGTISATPVETVVTNSRDTGSLEVKKTVVSDRQADHDKTFTFAITLKDGNDAAENVDGKFGDIDFIDGMAEVYLKDGQSVKATGLPEGLDYIVTEADDDTFVITWTGNTGTIDSDTPAVAEFTNTRELVDVEVEKVWEDSDNKFKIRPESITVELLADGDATGQTLVLDESKQWKGSFAGLDKFKKVNGELIEIDYTIDEVSVPSYTTAITAKEGKKNSFVITNTIDLGDLVIEKDLDNFYIGDNEEVKKVVFAFKVEGFFDKNGDGTIDEQTEKIFETMVGITFDGSGTNSETLKNLPAGMLIKVTEQYSGTAYTPDTIGPEETTIIKTGEQGALATVYFSNKYSKSNEQSGVVNRFGMKDGKPEYQAPGGGWGGGGGGY